MTAFDFLDKHFSPIYFLVALIVVLLVPGFWTRRK